MLEAAFLINNSKQSGYGHHVRCKALAKIFSPQNKVKFIQKNHDKFLKKQRGLIAKNIITDSYNINYNLEKKIKKKCIRLITIDDGIKKRKFASDIIINYSPFIKKNFYKGAVKSECKLLLGSEYNFVRNFQPIKKYKNKKKFNIFIYFGRQKKTKIIKKTLDTIKNKEFINKVFIFGNNFKKETQYNFLKKMDLSDLILTSSGITLQKALGKKKLIFSKFFSYNQKLYHDYYRKKKIIYDLKFFEKFINYPIKKINLILKKKNENKNVVKQFNHIINLKNIISPLKDEINREIKIKNFKSNFSKKIFLLQTKSNRKFFKIKNKLYYSSHKLYLKNFFKNEYNLIFLIFIDNKVAGFIKFKLLNNKYDISIIINKKYRSKGIATKVLNYFKNNNILAYNISASVMKKNTSSIKAFKKAGFTTTNLKIIK
jgi:spore coat polysaccharide biosynthesis predicted glycosyltransferase SpsG